MRGRRTLRRRGALVSALALWASGAYGLDLPNPLANMFGGSDESNAAETGRPASGGGLECPEILVDEGSSAVRVPAGADSASVRYQLSLNVLARECSVQDDKILIKVGVEGAAVLGPSGQAGTYGGTLRISARRQKDEVILQSKSYRVSATVPPGGVRGEFRLIADPLSVPYLGPRAADDYEILVGFEQGGIEKSNPPKPRKRRRAQTQQQFEEQQ